MAAYTIVLAALLMLAGALADRIGRRTIFQVGLSLFTLGSWLCSLAPSLGWLVAFRVLQGVGGSMLNPAALGIITNTFTGPAERARAIALGGPATAHAALGRFRTVVRRRDATALIESLTQLGALAVAETKKNGMFVVPGLGRLVRVDRKARMGRNPATGEAIKIPAKKVVKFRIAKAVRDSIVPPKKK